MAVWYSIAVIASLFVLLFVFAGLSAQQSISPQIWIPAGALLWLAAFVAATWRLARSARVQQATITLAPVYLLQGVLILFTIVRLPFESASEHDVLGGMLLVWETWVVLFSLSFLFLAVCGRRDVPLRTWFTTVASAIIVAGSIYQQL